MTASCTIPKKKKKHATNTPVSLIPHSSNWHASDPGMIQNAASIGEGQASSYGDRDQELYCSFIPSTASRDKRTPRRRRPAPRKFSFRQRRRISIAYTIFKGVDGTFRCQAMNTSAKALTGRCRYVTVDVHNQYCAMHAADDDLVRKEVLIRCKAMCQSGKRCRLDALVVSGKSTDLCGIHSLCERRCQANTLTGGQCHRLVVELEDGTSSIFCPIHGGAPCCQGKLDDGTQCDYPVYVHYGKAGKFCSHHLAERTRCLSFTANGARCTILAGLNEEGKPTKYCQHHLRRYQKRRRSSNIYRTKNAEVGTGVSIDGRRKQQRQEGLSRTRLESVLTGRHKQSKRRVSGDDTLLAGDNGNESKGRLYRLARWLYHEVLDKDASGAHGFAKMLVHEMELDTAEAAVQHLVPGTINMKDFASSKKHKKWLKENLRFLRGT